MTEINKGDIYNIYNYLISYIGTTFIYICSNKDMFSTYSITMVGPTYRFDKWIDSFCKHKFGFDKEFYYYIKEFYYTKLKYEIL